MKLRASKTTRRISTAAIFWIGLSLVTTNCGDGVFLDEALEVPTTDSGYFESGDIIIVSGGAVARTATPYPIHSVTQWSATGAYKRTLSLSPSTTAYYYGADFDSVGSKLYFTIENVDRVDKIDTSTLVTTTHILDANLNGATLRAMAVLSDGGVVVAESITVIEKFDSAQARVTTNFPITVTATINQIKRISGGRFVVLFSGNPDNPKVYSNDGTLVATLSGIACTTNCDPYDIVELADGRFVVSIQNASYHSLELFDSNFTYVGQLYADTNVMLYPGAMDLMANGDILVCSATLNTCEEIAISGNSGTRVGSKALISDASLMRQPTTVRVVP